MGQIVSKMMTRIFECPVKTKPICFYKQSDFTPTGELKIKPPEVKTRVPSEYDKLRDLFAERLKERRRREQDLLDVDTRWDQQLLLDRFPGWNKPTLHNLHLLYLQFNNQTNGLLEFDEFAAVLENVGDESSMDARQLQFNAVDTDSDGWINYSEFLALIYNFNPPVEGRPTGVALLCKEAADNIEFISSLTLGEQLQYGFF